VRSGDAAPAGDGSHHRRREAPQPVGRHYDRSPMMPRGEAYRCVGRAAVSKARAGGSGRSGPRRGSGIVDGPQENAAPPAHASSAEGRAKSRRGGRRTSALKRGQPPGASPAPATPRIFWGRGRWKETMIRMRTHRGNDGAYVNQPPVVPAKAETQYPPPVLFCAAAVIGSRPTPG
jgi:hypothetical protein